MTNEQNRHTPGPWKVHKNGRIVIAGGLKIYQSSGPGGGQSVSVQTAFDNQLRANARLIAAAPEMFELLEDIDNLIGEITEEAWQKLQGIIKRVKGNQ